MDENKVREIMSDETFVKQLLEIENPAEVQAAFKEKGIDLTENDILQIAEQVNKYVESGVSPDELSLEQMEEVSGGFCFGPLIGFLIVCVVCGLIIFPEIAEERRIRW